MKTLKIKDLMTRRPLMIKPMQTVKEAANYMKKMDCGILPVGGPGRVIGIITDRDIALRVAGAGKDSATTTVKSIMTKKVYACNEGADVGHAAKKMRKHNVSRLVVTKGKRTTGIVTLKELLQNCGNRRLSDTVLEEWEMSQKKRPRKK